MFAQCVGLLHAAGDSLRDQGGLSQYVWLLLRMGLCRLSLQNMSPMGFSSDGCSPLPRDDGPPAQDAGGQVLVIHGVSRACCPGMVSGRFSVKCK